MVRAQLERRGITDRRVLATMASLPREKFVPTAIAGLAYADRPWAIGYGQTISQPYIVAAMTEALRLEGTERVLEIGTGSGYQTAILAELAGRVYTVERIAGLLEAARTRLTGLGYTNIEYRLGDGHAGWPEHAPFDGILVAAAATEIPGALVDQLEVNGRLVIPIGDLDQDLLIVHKTLSGNELISLGGVRFVPLVRDFSRP